MVNICTYMIPKFYNLPGQKLRTYRPITKQRKIDWDERIAEETFRPRSNSFYKSLVEKENNIKRIYEII